MFGRRPFLKRLGDDRRGVAAVEFAFIAPVLILAYFGVCELCGAMLAERKASHAASAIGDLVTQAQTLADSDVTDIFTVAQTIMLPYSSTGMDIRISSIQEQTNGTYQITWSCGSGYTALAKGAWTPPSNFNTGIIQSGQSVIMSEVNYVYNSPVQYVVPNAVTDYEVFYLRPRVVDPIPDPGTGSGCN
jgi:Flp pilus assembly protein TadG